MTCCRDFRQDLDVLLNHLTPNGTVEQHHISHLFFGNYQDLDADQRVYDEISNLENLTDVMNSYLKEYNILSKTPLSFVPFAYAMEHVSYVARVLLHNQGHMLLIGIAGSGRRTVAKLAGFISGMDLHQVEISRDYTVNEWREDLKTLLRRAGTEGKPFVFLLSDIQIKDEMFLEDINTVLASGDVPNLYTAEEKAEILERIQAVARELVSPLS